MSRFAQVGENQLGICAVTIDGKHRFELNADDVFPAASSIKLFVFYALLTRVEAGKMSLGDRIEFRQDAAEPGSGVLSHLEPGLRPTLKDLATLMMMISDNTALIMLVDHLGLTAINREIQGLGLTSTHLGNWNNFRETYADSLGLSASTPRELAEFLLRMQRGELLSATSREIFWDTLRIQKYIEWLRKYIPANPWAREFGLPEPVWVASKSGSLDDCSTESGIVTVHDGGWAISIMIRDMPEVSTDPHDIGERLISEISLAVYEAWAPLFEPEESS